MRVSLMIQWKYAGLLYGLLRNRGQGDARVGNALDGAGGAFRSLDTDT